MKKRMALGIFLILFVILIFFFVGQPPVSEDIVFGVNFSQKHSQNLQLDWKENYLALLDDLGVKRLKLISHWDMLEPEEDNFYFEDLDWQIQEAEKRNVKTLLVIGLKTGRWPECHIPEWAKDLNKEQQQQRILILLERIVGRYQDNKVIWAWQVENEPFFPFGECIWKDKEFVKKEIAFVRSLDQRPIVFSDSGEGSLWFTAAKLGDVVGVTMYKRVWFKELEKYVFYPFPPVFYWRKAELVKSLFNKRVIVTELQAEPWGPRLLYDSPLAEQEKTMNLKEFNSNVSFARKTGLDEFYLWGAEWWYWLKEKHNSPEIWQRAKELF